MPDPSGERVTPATPHVVRPIVLPSVSNRPQSDCSDLQLGSHAYSIRTAECSIEASTSIKSGLRSSYIPMLLGTLYQQANSSAAKAALRAHKLGSVDVVYKGGTRAFLASTTHGTIQVAESLLIF